MDQLVSSSGIAIRRGTTFAPTRSRARRLSDLIGIRPPGATHFGECLTPRECDVLNWVACGKTDFEVAAILMLSPKTVNFHVENAKRKLGASSRVHAVAIAVRTRLISATIEI